MPASSPTGWDCRSRAASAAASWPWCPTGARWPGGDRDSTGTATRARDSPRWTRSPPTPAGRCSELPAAGKEASRLLADRDPCVPVAGDGGWTTTGSACRPERGRTSDVTSTVHDPMELLRTTLEERFQWHTDRLTELTVYSRRPD